MTEKQKKIKSLYDEYRGDLLGLANAIILNEADAEDLVQEVFIRAMYSYDELKNHTNPKAWLFVTLKNCIKNYSRLCANRLEISLEEFGDIVGVESDESLSHILPKQLSDTDRRLLIWRFEQRLGYREISSRLGISEEACRVKVCRIIKRCRKLMDR